MGRPKTFDETAALDQAMQVFWAKGYAPTSLTDLLAATGLSKSSLYETFGSKHDLFLKALERYRDVDDAVSLWKVELPRLGLSGIDRRTARHPRFMIDGENAHRTSVGVHRSGFLTDQPQTPTVVERGENRMGGRAVAPCDPHLRQDPDVSVL